MAALSTYLTELLENASRGFHDDEESLALWVRKAQSTVAKANPKTKLTTKRRTKSKAQRAPQR